jgi:hypothetical protein
MPPPISTDPFDLHRLAVAHDREAAWCQMRARTLLAEGDRHRRSAARLRALMYASPTDTVAGVMDLAAAAEQKRRAETEVRRAQKHNRHIRGSAS